MQARIVRERISRTAGRIALGAALLLSAVLAAAAAPSTVVNLSPDQGALPELLQREVAKARKLGQTPFAQITAEWCGPCKKLRASMNDPLMKDAFAGTYVIRLDIDAWGKQVEPVGLKSDAIPVFFLLGESGRATGPTVNGGAWGEDIPRNMAPPLSKFFRANGAKP
jgi:thiol-disulfide isomerase/thioredoxin